MIPAELLLRLLIVALDRLPDHEVVADAATWERLMTEREAHPGGGLMIRQDGSSVSAKLADHEDRAVMVDRARAAGMVIVDAPDFTLGFDL